MNILVQLSHPAHFHLYKNVAKNLMNDGHQVFILIKTKDILEDLLRDAGLPYYNILRVPHRKNKLGILLDMLLRDWRIMCFSIKHRIDLLTGSTPEVAHVSWLLRKKSINTGEDDMAVVPAFAKVAGPFIQSMLSPVVCDNAGIESMTIHYSSYQELAYLHPNHFKAEAGVVEKYGIQIDKPYFILRFASLNAHHDTGIKGINTDIAQHLVDMLNPHGTIYITSERPLEPQFEQYRIHINPLDMHHVMAFASLYIGDSQTMAAEAGVLGVPFVRYNDFVGRIGYLRELEDVYVLGYGFKASEAGSPERMYSIVDKLLSMPNLKDEWKLRRQRMLADKIDYAKFLTWFIENYPKSVGEVKDADNDFWVRFK